jgi:hypothetical protein
MKDSNWISGKNGLELIELTYYKYILDCLVMLNKNSYATSRPLWVQIDLGF